jgi:hypothetical protein
MNMVQCSIVGLECFKSHLAEKLGETDLQQATQPPKGTNV